MPHFYISVGYADKTNAMSRFLYSYFAFQMGKHIDIDKKAQTWSQTISDSQVGFDNLTSSSIIQ